MDEVTDQIAAAGRCYMTNTSDRRLAVTVNQTGLTDICYLSLCPQGQKAYFFIVGTRPDFFLQHRAIWV
jgi:hypothetical protein